MMSDRFAALRGVAPASPGGKAPFASSSSSPSAAASSSGHGGGEGGGGGGHARAFDDSDRGEYSRDYLPRFGYLTASVLLVMFIPKEETGAARHANEKWEPRNAKVAVGDKDMNTLFDVSINFPVRSPGGMPFSFMPLRCHQLFIFNFFTPSYPCCNAGTPLTLPPPPPHPLPHPHTSSPGRGQPG